MTHSSPDSAEASALVNSAYDELCVRFSGVHSDDAMDSVLLRLHAALKKLGVDPMAPYIAPEAVAGERKTVYVKRWRTLVSLPAQYADEIVEALRTPAQAAGSNRQHATDCSIYAPGQPCDCEGAPPQAARWQPIETASQRVQEFARARKHELPRGPVVQLGGSLEDGSIYLFGHHALTHEVQQWIVIPALYCRSIDALSRPERGDTA